MASTYTDLGIELMVTGENAGTWGDKTNTNLSLIEQLTGGVLSISIAGESPPLSVSAVICLTSNSNNIPVFLNFECFIFIKNIFIYKY